MVPGILTFGFHAASAWAFAASYDQQATQNGQVYRSKVTIKDQQFRIESEAEGMKTIMIRNANGLYSYVGEGHVTMRLPATAPMQQPVKDPASYSRYLSQRQARVVGSETVNGYTCDIYEFTDESLNAPAKAWVWKEKQFPVKVEIQGPEGVLVTELSNIRIDPPLSDTLFQLPPGTQIMDAGHMGNVQEMIGAMDGMSKGSDRSSTRR